MAERDLTKPAETVTMLVLSTAHLRQATCTDWLEHHCPWACYAKGEVGWFMYVPGTPAGDLSEYDEYVSAPIPNELRPIIAYAHEHQFSWIMFDNDGPEQLGLVTYDW